MPVKFHIRDGARFSVRSGSSSVLAFIADVSGVSGTESKMLIDAYRHPGMLREGSAVPGVPNMTVTGVDGEIIGPNTVRFSITAEDRFVSASAARRKEETPSGLIQIGASLSTVETQRDAEGKPLTVNFIDSTGQQLEEQPITADISIPQPVRRIDRVETKPNLSLADQYVGTVNNRPIWGREARTLIVREIGFTSSNGGASWNATYSFQYNPQSWDGFFYYRDPVTDKPIKGVKDGNGVERRRMYPETDFSKIGVTFPNV